MDNMSSSAEKNLKVASYKGESKKWTFDKYVRVHMDQHQILNDLKEHGYAGIDERSKVRHLKVSSAQLWTLSRTPSLLPLPYVLTSPHAYPSTKISSSRRLPLVTTSLC